MPIHSYLLYAQKDKKGTLMTYLNTVDGCLSVASLNNEVVVLVTETFSEQEEDNLQEKLMFVPGLLAKSLVFSGEV